MSNSKMAISIITLPHKYIIWLGNQDHEIGDHDCDNKEEKDFENRPV